MATNAELLAEYKEVSSHIKELEKQNRLAERNELVPRIWELDKLIDWNYKVGESVEIRTGRSWEVDVILDIDGNQFRFKSVVLPHQMIRKTQKSPPNSTSYSTNCSGSLDWIMRRLNGYCSSISAGRWRREGP